jgi:uncharacterized protein YbbK (DUF523 family)
LISGCLLGQKVRYDGKDSLQKNSRLDEWIKAGKVFFICPEMAGGLPTPRSPAEIVGDKVLTINGKDVTAEYLLGAQKTLALAQKHNIRVAILKARSPSCGSKQIYDGTHSKTLIDGMGTTTALLIQHGIQVFDETEIEQALDAAATQCCLREGAKR